MTRPQPEPALPYRVKLPTAAERRNQNHAIEWQYGWQYAETVRTLRDLSFVDFERELQTVPAVLLVAPEGDGWEINDQIGDNGYRAKAPAWCKDGTVLRQRVHWRRVSPGMHMSDLNHKITVTRDDA